MKLVSKVIVATLGGLLFFSLAGCGGEEASTDKTYTVRFSTDTVDDSVLTKYVKEFAKEVEKNSNGKIKFKIFTAGTLYKGKAGLEATQSGNLEMCLCALSNYGEYSQKIFLLSLPFVFPTNQAVFDAYSGKLGQLAVQDISKYNLDFLSYFIFGGTDLSSKKLIQKPSDLNGLKIRVFGLANASFVRSCTGAPTFMSGGEVTQALSSGLIDGALTGAESMVKRKYYEFQPHLCAIGFERADQMIVMNHVWWTKLPKDLQSIVVSAMDKARVKEWKEATTKEEESRKELEKKGMKVYYPTIEEMKLWHSYAENVYTEFRSILGNDLIDEAIKFRNQYLKK